MSPDPYVQAIDEFHTRVESLTGVLQSEDPPEWRSKLILEEAIEADEAIRATDDLGRAPADLAHVAKELADCLYVVFGSARRFGIPLPAIFRAVHENNMLKLQEPVKFNDNGKLLKKPDHPSALPAVRDILAAGAVELSSEETDPQTLCVDGIDVDADKAVDAVRRCVTAIQYIDNAKRLNRKQLLNILTGEYA